MNRDTIHEDEPAADPRIDLALRIVGSAMPKDGFEGRILNRLAAARVAGGSKPSPVSWITGLPRFSRQALGVITACGLCLAIVVGSVGHSRRTSHGAAPPALPVGGQGIGAASAVHPAAPASTPAPAGEPGRTSRSSDRSADRGRARIAPHSRKAPGAVPAPPANKAGDSQ